MLEVREGEVSPGLFCSMTVRQDDMYQRRYSIHFNGINLLLHAKQRPRSVGWENCCNEMKVYVGSDSVIIWTYCDETRMWRAGGILCCKSQAFSVNQPSIVFSIRAGAGRLLNQVKYSWYVKVTLPTVKLFNLTWQVASSQIRQCIGVSVVWPPQLAVSATEGDNLKLKLLQLRNGH